MQNETLELNKLFVKDQQAFPEEQSSTSIDDGAEPLPEDLRNRHVRRLEAKLQAEREANIASAARIEVLSEAQKLREQSTQSGWEEKARRIYGNDKPENAAASDLLVQSIREATESAKREILEETRSEYRQQAEEENKEIATVQGYIEQIEDHYGVDLTSNNAQGKQREFKDLWFKLSPKDSNGEVTEYADPFEVFEIFNSRQPSNRAKDISSRSMIRSRSVDTPVQDDATVKYLRDNGIIDSF